MKILLTGFEPWAEWSTNPSGAVAESLHGISMGGCEVVSAVLPVVHGADIAKVGRLIVEHEPGRWCVWGCTVLRLRCMSSALVLI